MKTPKPTTTKSKEIRLVLHNIRSAYNVGSIFRTADAAGISKIYLGGYTPNPDQESKIFKTSLGAEKTVPWEHHRQTWWLLEKLKKKRFHIIALEQAKGAIDYRKFKPEFPMILILGNEVRGLSQKISKHADQIIEIPMRGQKESLNVSVAAGIILYHLCFQV